MGRRLAVRMVDRIVYNFLEFDCHFYNGVIPSMFTRKEWHERTVATAAAYNFPADLVLIRIKRPALDRTSGSRVRNSTGLDKSLLST